MTNIVDTTGSTACSGNEILSITVVVNKNVVRQPTSAICANDLILTSKLTLENATFTGRENYSFQTSAPAEIKFPDAQTLCINAHAGAPYVDKHSGKYEVPFPPNTMILQGVSVSLINASDVAVVGEMTHVTPSGTFVVSSELNPAGNTLDANTASRKMALYVRQATT